MKVKVVGIERANFKPKDEEREVKFVRVYACKEKSGVEGFATCTFNTSEKKMQEFGQLAPNMELDIEYNEHGKVESYKVLK